MQQRLQRPRQMAALIAALVEFQKTQVFFMLTIEVAVVIALYYGTHVDATSRAQLWNNVIFMRYVGYSGLDPVVFGKLLLRKVGKLSRYVCVASACCVLVASVAVLKSLTAGVELEQVRHFIPRLDECAFEAPTQYCSRLRVGYLRVPRTVALVWWAVSPAIMLVLLLEKCDALYTPRLRSAIGKAAKWIAIGKSGRARDLRGSKAGYSRLALIFAEVWLVINMCMSIRSYAAFLPDTNTTAADGIWPLGQIIAVGVWIPGIVEFLYLLLRKLRPFPSLERTFQTLTPTVRRYRKGLHVPLGTALPSHGPWEPKQSYQRQRAEHTACGDLDALPVVCYVFCQ